MADMDYEETSDVDIEGGKNQRRSAAGRKLMRWNPDVDQYVLLAVDIVCTEQGTPVPWNFVAEKLNDYVTGEGIKQHLAKVRKYREQNGRPVPMRSTKGSNRKAAAYGTGITNTPRTPRKKIGDDGDDGEGPVTGKGAGLLWTNPKQKASKPPKEPKEVKELKEPKSQKPTDARKKAQGDNTALVTPKKPRKANAKADDEEQIASKKKSTGKRGRTKKEASIKEEVDDDDVENGSPTKRQRILRPGYYVNYDETQNAGDDFDEDVFDARADDDGEDFYDDGLYGSQPNTQPNSGNASSRSSGTGMTTQAQPPPNFDSMLHSRTGMHVYGGDYMDDIQNYNFAAPLTDQNTNYAPGSFNSGENMGVSGGDMMVGQGSYFASLTADQLQMHAQNNEMSGFGNTQQSYDRDGAAASAPRTAMKQSSRAAEEQGSTTPLGKNKKKNKSQHSTKHATKQKGGSGKTRKDSAHGSHNSDEQPAVVYSNDIFGNIPIANDTGRDFGQFYGQGMPNFSMPLTTYEPQPAPTLTASPTDMGKGFDFSSAAFGHAGNVTGITPHFNNFNFGPDTISGGGDGYKMHGSEFNSGLGNVGPFDGMGGNGMSTNHTRFSSSNKTSVTGSQGDQSFSGMQFHAGGGGENGLGLGDVYVPEMGMSIDMSGEGEQDQDVFSLLNHERHH